MHYFLAALRPAALRSASLRCGSSVLGSASLGSVHSSSAGRFLFHAGEIGCVIHIFDFEDQQCHRCYRRYKQNHQNNDDCFLAADLFLIGLILCIDLCDLVQGIEQIFNLILLLPCHVQQIPCISLHLSIPVFGCGLGIFRRLLVCGLFLYRLFFYRCLQLSG